MTNQQKQRDECKTRFTTVRNTVKIKCRTIKTWLHRLCVLEDVLLCPWMPLTVSFFFSVRLISCFVTRPGFQMKSNEQVHSPGNETQLGLLLELVHALMFGGLFEMTG